MKKLLFLACSLFAAATCTNAQTAAAARAAGVGSNVSVRGVVINGAELDKIRYIQDVTGGIPVYGGNVNSLNLGDSVIASGTLTEFNNLLEITPATYVLVSTNAKVPAPQVITPSQFDESKEAELIKIMNCTFAVSGTFPNSPTNYTVTSNGQTFALRSNSVIAGKPIPTGTVNITGVGSQFCPPATSSGCTTGYQLLPRTMTDFEASVVVPTGIEEVNTTTRLSVYPNPASSVLNFNLSSYEKTTSTFVTDFLGKTVFTSYENIHTIDISMLPQGIYNLSVSTGKTTYQSKFIVH